MHCDKPNDVAWLDVCTNMVGSIDFETVSRPRANTRRQKLLEIPHGLLDLRTIVADLVDPGCKFLWSGDAWTMEVFVGNTPESTIPSSN